MTRLQKISITLLLFAVTHAVTAQNISTALSNRIDSFLQNEISQTATTGLAAAVVQNGEVVYKKTFGMANLEWDAPVQSNTVFQTASVTKLITSTLLLQWVHQGKIKLTDPIHRYLKDAPANWSKIEIRHLLSHQSGLPWPASIGGFIGVKATSASKAPTREQIYRDIRDSALTFEPGTRESYMNGDHFILQMIIENIAQKSFPQVVKEELLLPFGMTDGGYDAEFREFPLQLMKTIPHKAQLYTKGNPTPYILKNFYNPNSYTSAGLYLSLNDFIRWASVLDSLAGNNKSMEDSLYQPMPVGGFTQFGWVKEQVYNQSSFGHSGGPGLSHVIRIPATNTTIIVLSNYADLLPYMAYGIAGILQHKTDIKEKTATDKTFSRGLEKKL
ncbi:MAG TPA: serine hydrolase domain-containing protein [Sediminibacterium sp.]